MIEDIANMTAEAALGDTPSPIAKERQIVVPGETRTELILVNNDATDIRDKYALPDMIIEIRPVDAQKWHKQTGADSFARPVTIEAFYSSSHGGYNTGLTKEEKEYLEAMTGFKLDGKFNAEIAHEFWSTATARVKLENQTQLLDISNAINYIKYKLCKACSLVANSLDEFNKGIWFEATHYIHNEEERITIQAQDMSITRRAYKIIDNLTLSEKRKLLQVATGRTVGNKSDNGVDVGLEELITKRPQDIITFSSMDKNKLAAMSFIYDAVYKNVLIVRKGSYYYGEHMIGFNLEETATHLADPQNQEMAIAIKTKINARN